MRYAAALLLCACVPDPCPFDLSGTWVNASDPSFAYRLRDARGAVEGELAADASVTLRLLRPSLSGSMRAPAASKSGKPCPFDFSLRVTICRAGELQIRAEAAAQLDDDCRRVAPARPDLVEFLWIRRQ